MALELSPSAVLNPPVSDPAFADDVDRVVCSVPLDSEDCPIHCLGLVKRFGANLVVNQLDLAVRKGELVALLGPSGCGKTTTLRLIAGLEMLDAGRIEIDGRVVARPRQGVPPERRNVGMVFQDYALFPHLSVRRNVAFGMPRGRVAAVRVDEVLRLVGLDHRMDAMPHELSGGQQQRIALARALAPNPALILLDEPFSNLDVDLRTAVRRDVRRILAEAGATAILVTHDQEEALSLADRVAVMWQGRILQCASPEELYHRPANRQVATFVGDSQFIRATASGRRAGSPLGDLPLVNQAHGEVDLLVRPEMIRLSPDPDGTVGNGRVAERAFFGSYQLMTVALDCGLQLKARLGSYGGFRGGDRVNVGVRGGVLAFPADEAGA